jgi:hypothetical protein
VYPNSHAFLAKIFRLAMVTTLIGTTAETILTMFLFGSLWHRWTIAFKVTTPMLHVLFASAQLWGSWNFYKMWQKQKRLMAQKEDGFDMEASLKNVPNMKDQSLVVDRPVTTESRAGSQSSITELVPTGR